MLLGLLLQLVSEEERSPVLLRCPHRSLYLSSTCAQVRRSPIPRLILTLLDVPEPLERSTSARKVS